MAAGQRCCAVGVIRLILGDVFPEKCVNLEAHHGIEDEDGHVEYTRLEEHPLAWKKAKSLVKAQDWKAVLRFVAACEEALIDGYKPAKGKRLEKFVEEKVGKPAKPFNPL